MVRIPPFQAHWAVRWRFVFDSRQLQNIIYFFDIFFSIQMNPLWWYFRLEFLCHIFALDGLLTWCPLNWLPEENLRRALLQYMPISFSISESTSDSIPPSPALQTPETQDQTRSFLKLQPSPDPPPHASAKYIPAIHFHNHILTREEPQPYQHQPTFQDSHQDKQPVCFQPTHPPYPHITTPQSSHPSYHPSITHKTRNPSRTWDTVRQEKPHVSTTRATWRA